MESQKPTGSTIGRLFKKAASLVLLIGLSACASTKLTPLPESNPASPSARESPMSPPQYNLQPDEATIRTKQILNSQETSSPSSGKKEDSNPVMNHGGMQ